MPLTPYLAGIFQYLRMNRKLPPSVRGGLRAVEMRHVLLVLPFLLDGLLDPTVLEEQEHPLRPVHDASTELVGITNRQDWVLSARLKSRKALFSSEFIISGSANGFCCSRLTKTDAGMKKHACAFVSVLEEYRGHLGVRPRG
jgi:hypothetical protein